MLRLHYVDVSSSDREVIRSDPLTKSLRAILGLWVEGKTPKPHLISAVCLWRSLDRKGDLAGHPVVEQCTSLEQISPQEQQ